MAQLIDLTCECGKDIQVPHWRCGQKGRCTVCNSKLVVPSFEPTIEIEKNLEDAVSLPKIAEVSEQPLPQITELPELDDNGGFSSELPEIPELDSSVADAPISEEAQAKPANGKGRLLLLLLLSMITFAIGIVAGVALGPTYFGIIDEKLVPTSIIEPLRQISLIKKMRYQNDSPVKPGVDKPIAKPVKPTIVRNVPGTWYQRLVKIVSPLEISFTHKKYDVDRRKTKKCIHSILKLVYFIKKYRAAVEKIDLSVQKTINSGKSFTKWMLKNTNANKQRQLQLAIFKKFVVTGEVTVDIAQATRFITGYGGILKRQVASGSVKFSTAYQFYRRLKQICVALKKQKTALNKIALEFTK